MEVSSMTLAPDAPDTTTADPPTVAAATRRAISEDWAATIVGLVLLALVMAGILTDGLIP
jgi:hypothetical protein